MTEHKRLTTKEKYPHGAEGVSKDKLTGKYCRGVFEATACVEKLAEYETAEEEGRLVVLPCKLNETVYLLLNKNDFAEKIIKCRIREVSIGFCGVKLSLISEDSMIGHLDWYDVEEVGKAVFLTREEAEKVLKEMEGKHETSN